MGWKKTLAQRYGSRSPRCLCLLELSVLRLLSPLLALTFVIGPVTPVCAFLYMSQCLNQWRPVSFYGTKTGIWPGIWESNLCDVQSRQIRESRRKYFHLRINTFKVKQQWMWFKGALYGHFQTESIHLEGLLPTANKICLVRNSWFVLCRPHKTSVSISLLKEAIWLSSPPPLSAPSTALPSPLWLAGLSQRQWAGWQHALPTFRKKTKNKKKRSEEVLLWQSAQLVI